mmetsp:Transcript_17554/g.38391  ORF Transcript_17554/g.38391 Transcript_17554/m.38391 type:complete len:250 (-) Transcript_17554:1928-2677(-)
MRASLFPPGTAITAGFLVSQAFSALVLSMIVKASLAFRDISDALAFYGVYHQDKVNQVIHFFGVPGILYTALLFTVHLPLPFVSFGLPSLPLLKPHRVTWGTAATVWYMLFYVKIDRFGGSLFALVVYAMYASAVRWYERDQAAAQKKGDEVVSWMGTGKVLRYAALLHVLCWYVQIHPGHAIYEGAKPALMDSVGGALSTAPLFAFYEALWMIGVNKELQTQTLEQVAKYTVELCQSDSTSMRVCTTL